MEKFFYGGFTNYTSKQDFFAKELFLFSTLLKRRPNGADCKNFQSPVSPSWGLYLDWHLPQALRQAYDVGEKQPGS